MGIKDDSYLQCHFCVFKENCEDKETFKNILNKFGDEIAPVIRSTPIKAKFWCDRFEK